MNAPSVLLLDAGKEVWRGPIRQFYRNNDMVSSAARKIHKQLRRYDFATVGGGASGDMELWLLPLKSRLAVRISYQSDEQFRAACEGIK